MSCTKFKISSQSLTLAYLGMQCSLRTVYSVLYLHYKTPQFYYYLFPSFFPSRLLQPEPCWRIMASCAQLSAGAEQWRRRRMRVRNKSRKTRNTENKYQGNVDVEGFEKQKQRRRKWFISLKQLEKTHRLNMLNIFLQCIQMFRPADV